MAFEPFDDFLYSRLETMTSVGRRGGWPHFWYGFKNIEAHGDRRALIYALFALEVLVRRRVETGQIAGDPAAVVAVIDERIGSVLGLDDDWRDAVRVSARAALDPHALVEIEGNLRFGAPPIALALFVDDVRAEMRYAKPRVQKMCETPETASMLRRVAHVEMHPELWLPEQTSGEG